MFKLCLANTEETLKTAKVKSMRNLKFYDYKSGRCGREKLKGEDRKTAEPIGSEMLTIKCFSYEDSSKVSYFFIAFHREKLQYCL